MEIEEEKDNRIKVVPRATHIHRKKAIGDHADVGVTSKP
jgi:hypothetical protein